MNNQRLQFTLAILLLIGIVGLTAFMLWHPVELSPDVKAIVEGIIGQLVAVLVFVCHAVFAPHYANPTVPASPAEK